MRSGEILAGIGDERGGVLVMVALWLPVLVLLASFVIDVGNWFEHKRHLQLQADAGALAAAQDFRIPCSDPPIVAQAQKYSGGQYNAQVGGTSSSQVHMLINSLTYYNQSSPVDSTVNPSPPCSAVMVDVKMTETDLPWFLRLARVPFINAHARVSILQKDTTAGALPVGVPDVNPKVARVTFFNETPPYQILGTQALTPAGSANGLALWDNSGAPLPITVNAANIGIRVSLGGGTSTTCGQPLVESYDATSPLDASSCPTRGILYVRGWTGAGSGAQPNAPLARDVTLFNGSCADPYFSFSAATCTIGVRAKVDIGSLSTSSASITANVNGTSHPLTYNSSTGYWESTGANFFSVPANAGPLPVTLNWAETSGTEGGNTCKTGNGNKCTGSFGVVQRTYSATSAGSGPIQLAQVWENGSFDVNSFQMCSAVLSSCTHSLVVRIGVKGSLQDAQSVSDPIVSLRVVGGSQNQSLDCDPNLPKLKDELARGCAPQYTKNTGTACPGSPTVLWSTTQPWPCVALQTGSATNQVPEGMNTRILGSPKPSSCTAPNHWSLFPDLPTGDPRIIQVFLTPFGSFSGNGSNTVPVTGFATFYVTGWTGQGTGFSNPCQGNGDDPVPNNDAGYIVGHFIKYIDVLNTGGGTQLCDLTAFGTCVAVLTE